MGTHIRSYQIRYSEYPRWNSESFSSCFSLLPQLSQQGRSSPSMTAPELLTWHQPRSHFHLTPKNAWTQFQLPKWKKSPKTNSWLPSKIVNFRMLHTFYFVLIILIIF